MASNHGTESADTPDSAAAFQPSVETRGQRLSRHGHRARLYTWAGLLVAVFVVLVVLASSNTAAVKLDWVVGSTHASLVWIILAAAVLGWVLGIATAVVVHHRTRRPH